MTVYRADDMRRTLAAFGAIANTETGLGTSRDKSTYAEVVSVPLLSQEDRTELVKSSRICRRVIEIYPLEAGDNWCEFVFSEAKYKNYGFNPDSLTQYLDNLRTGSFRSSLINGSIEARWNGNGFLLMAIDDGKNWFEPVDEKNIKSVRWIEVLYDFEVTPDSFSASYSKVEFYRVNKYNSALPEGDRYLLVHRSRIIHLAGDRLSGMALQESGGKHLSVLQAMYAAYAQCMQGLAAASAMLQDYSVFLYKFAGLEQIMSEHREKVEAGEVSSLSYPQAVMDRFLTIQMSMSVIKGIIMDGGTENLPGESAEFVNRNFGGIDSVLDRLIEQMVASTDLPRSKVLGTANQAGLGAEGRGEQDRYAWAQAVGAWQNRNWRDPIKYVSKLCLLAKDGVTGGRLPAGYDVNFPSILELTDSEKMTLRKTHIDSMNVAVAAGFLNPYEVRMSTYGGVRWSYDVALDPDVTKKMKESMFPEETETPPPPPQHATSNNGGNPPQSPQRGEPPQGAALRNGVAPEDAEDSDKQDSATPFITTAEQLLESDLNGFESHGSIYEIKTPTAYLYALNFPNTQTVIQGYSQTHKEDILRVEDVTGKITDLLDHHADSDDIHLDKGLTKVKGNLCRTAQGKFVSCGEQALIKVESSYARSRREAKEARGGRSVKEHKAYLESQKKITLNPDDRVILKGLKGLNGVQDASVRELRSAGIRINAKQTNITTAQQERISKIRNGFNTHEEWLKSAPSGEDQTVYAGERVVLNSKPAGVTTFKRGKLVSSATDVDFTVDNTWKKADNPSPPFQELKDMTKAWKEFINSPNGERFFIATAYNEDSAHEARVKAYQGIGFKVVEEKDKKILEKQGVRFTEGQVTMYLDNRKKKK